jgi:hypothetical protein
MPTISLMNGFKIRRIAQSVSYPTQWPSPSWPAFKKFETLSKLLSLFTKIQANASRLLEKTFSISLSITCQAIPICSAGQTHG